MESWAFEDGRGWESWFRCACREDRAEAGCRRVASSGNGVLQAARSAAEPALISVFTASLESLQPGRSIFSILNLVLTSQCASRLQTSHPN